MTRKVAVIGSGFSGLTAAGVLSKKGYDVTIFEKNTTAGGRARSFAADGYLFDMGPSWYWMPDVFERYFSLFNKKSSDFYELKKLDPGFAVFFGKGDCWDIPVSIDGIYELFEREEPGAGAKLKKFLAEAELKYKLAMTKLVYKPALSLTEYMDRGVLGNLHRLDIFRSFRSHARRFFTNPRLLQVIEFPVLFLGGTADNIPALYSLMNYAAFNLSTWYPMGGFSKITEALLSIATAEGAELHLDEAISTIEVRNSRATRIRTTKGVYDFDAVIGAADYEHTESLLPETYANHKPAYWDSRTYAPSSLLFYLGIKKKIPGLRHHNLFFDESLDVHAAEIYDHPQWPSKPLFYVCCPSKTDPGVAPEGHENVFVLMPLAPDLDDEEEVRERYFQLLMARLERITGESILPFIAFKRSYCVSDFKADYHACKGNAYGLANTLRQTAVLRPSVRNRKVKNLFYCGHLTVPGPGVPPAIISGQIAADQLIKSFAHES